MDDPTPNRAIKNSGMPASSVVLATAFHGSIILALLWSPPTTSTLLMPEDAIEVTIERQTTPLATMIHSVAIPEPPADSPPIQLALSVPQQPIPQVESAPTPTLENAVPEPEPPPDTIALLENALPKPEAPPEVTLRDFPKAGSVVRKIEEKKPSPKSDPKPDSNKASEPPPGGTLPNASPPAPLPNRADVVQPNKNSKNYLERMGIKPSHIATLSEKSGATCVQDSEPYKLELTNNRLTATNSHGVMFSTTVPANGEIYHRFKRIPVAGDRPPFGWVRYFMIGNVKTGKLEIWKDFSPCVYKVNLY